MPSIFKSPSPVGYKPPKTTTLSRRNRKYIILLHELTVTESNYKLCVSHQLLWKGSSMKKMYL
ncbi:unnamed protein product [Lupinus luteus]|uniref:Uncharacterized protein n=1 Tax=Lupinus luteus TaxID=3873 RepID=A0AAV1XJW6_LUPLU